jgi:hypothetical protein
VPVVYTRTHTHISQSPYCAGNYLSVVWPCACPVINFKSICIGTISLLICPWFTQHAIWHNACHKQIGETGWDLNPRPSAYQPNALTDWTNLGVHTLACLNGVFYIMHHRRHVRFTCMYVHSRALLRSDRLANEHGDSLIWYAHHVQTRSLNSL